MKTLTFIVALLVLAACSGGQPKLRDKGYSLTGQDPSFRFEVDRQVLRDWGGSGSPKFNQVLEEELERLGICRSGYALRNEGVRDGVFRVTGRCKS
jgi:hypothetical protein